MCATWEAFRQSGHTITTQITHPHCLAVAREKTFHLINYFHFIIIVTQIFIVRETDNRSVSDLFNYIYSYLLISLEGFAGQMSLK